MSEKIQHVSPGDWGATKEDDWIPEPEPMEPKFVKPIMDAVVDHPAHYTQGGIECIQAIHAACTGLSGIEGYCVGNVIKYMWRWKLKNGIEDLHKAQWYLNTLIKEEER